MIVQIEMLTWGIGRSIEMDGMSTSEEISTRMNDLRREWLQNFKQKWKGSREEI